MDTDLDTGYWILDTGCWLLVTGHWSLGRELPTAAGHWSLGRELPTAAGHWLLVTFAFVSAFAFFNLSFLIFNF
jgi:hypothetical protein